jgi:hypothetical protein
MESMKKLNMEQKIHEKQMIEIKQTFEHDMDKTKKQYQNEHDALFVIKRELELKDIDIRNFIEKEHQQLETKYHKLRHNVEEEEKLMKQLKEKQELRKEEKLQ